ncbi:MAG: hypothetical protein RIS86_2018 [Planctomycetota bacterium]
MVSLLRRTCAATGLAVCAAIAVIPGLAAATGTTGSNEVVSSNPAANQRVDVPPTQIQMVFRDPITATDAATSIRLVLACDGNLVGLGAPQLGTDLKTVSVALTQIPPAGQCTLSWSLPDESVGSFSFVSAVTSATTVTGTTLVPDPNATTLPGQPAPPGEEGAAGPGEAPRVGGILGLLRVLNYLLIASIFGGLIVLTIWPEGSEYKRAKSFYLLAWIGAVVTTYLIVVLTAMQREWGAFTDYLVPVSWFSALDYGGGWILVLRMVLVAAAGWVVLQPRRILHDETQVPSIALITSMMATLGMNRAGQDVAFMFHVLGIVHVLAIGVWVGALTLLVRAVLAGGGSRDLIDAVIGVGRLMSTLIITTVVTGGLQLYLMNGGNPFSSGHGLLGVLKLLATALMALFALAIKNFSTMSLDRLDELPGSIAARLRRAVSIEIGVAIFVFILSSWMLPMRSPVLASPSSSSKVTYAFVEELGGGKFKVVVSVTPATTGVNALKVELLEPARVNNLTVRLVPQAEGYAGIAISVPLTRRGAALVPGDGSLELKAPGIWSIEVTGATTTGELEPLATTFTVGDPSTATTVPGATTLVPGVPSTLAGMSGAPTTSLPPVQTTTGG